MQELYLLHLGPTVTLDEEVVLAAPPGEKVMELRNKMFGPKMTSTESAQDEDSETSDDQDKRGIN